jgi:hypothetical protein
MVTITEKEVSEQQAHSFANRTFNFNVDREERTQDLTLVRSIEIEPATMVPQPTGKEPVPGFIRIMFMPETTDKARGQIRKALVEAIPGELGGRDSDPWFTLTPNNGIVTQDTVKEALRILYENNAIVLSDVTATSKAIGLQPSAYWNEGDRLRNLEGLHDPNKPKDDRQDAELVAGLHLRSGGRY